jgi:hypothetical protein
MKISFFVTFYFSSRAQYVFNNALENNAPASLTSGYHNYASDAFTLRKLFQRNTGMIIGLPGGLNSAIELGGEAIGEK